MNPSQQVDNRTAIVNPSHRTAVGSILCYLAVSLFSPFSTAAGQANLYDAQLKGLESVSFVIDYSGPAGFADTAALRKEITRELRQTGIRVDEPDAQGRFHLSVSVHRTGAKAYVALYRFRIGQMARLARSNELMFASWDNGESFLAGPATGFRAQLHAAVQRKLTNFIDRYLDANGR